MVSTYNVDPRQSDLSHRSNAAGIRKYLIHGLTGIDEASQEWVDLD